MMLPPIPRQLMPRQVADVLMDPDYYNNMMSVNPTKQEPIKLKPKKKKKKSLKLEEKNNLIIGCGMPRSGTKSISKLLSNCKNVNIPHEFKICLPYEFNRNKLRQKLFHIEKLKGNIIGDVAHYYLNYIEELIKHHNAKIIVMKRDKKKVSKSIKSLGWNPYIQKKVEGSEAFPFYAKNVDTATEFYWDDYYKKIRELQHRFQNKILVVDIEWLNSKEGITKIFDFCEIPEEDRKYKTKIRENKHFGL